MCKWRCNSVLPDGVVINQSDCLSLEAVEGELGKYYVWPHSIPTHVCQHGIYFLGHWPLFLLQLCSGLDHWQQRGHQEALASLPVRCPCQADLQRNPHAQTHEPWECESTSELYCTVREGFPFYLARLLFHIMFNWFSCIIQPMVCTLHWVIRMIAMDDGCQVI